MATGDLERTGKPRIAAAGNGYSHSGQYYDEGAEKQWTSWLVPLIVAANVTVFVITMLVNNCPKNNLGFEGDCVAKFLGRLSFEPLKENPLFGPSSTTLDKMGALQWYKVVHGNEGWRLITCIWLHAGVIHLAANMLSLVFIGIRLEQQFGFVRVGLIYLVSGLGGSIMSSLFIQSNISVGASGALFGLLGAMLSELLTNWTIYTNKAAALFTLVVIIAINLAVGIRNPPTRGQLCPHRRFPVWIPPRLCLPREASVRVGPPPQPTLRHPYQIQVQGLPICAVDHLCSFANRWICDWAGGAV